MDNSITFSYGILPNKDLFGDSQRNLDLTSRDFCVWGDKESLVHDVVADPNAEELRQRIVNTGEQIKHLNKYRVKKR